MLEENIANWVNEITEEASLPPNCKAILIGLFEGEGGYVIYFVGSEEFTPEDDDWACESDSDYFPKNKYLQTGVATNENWEQFQEAVVNAVNKIKEQGNTILSQTANIAVGFDSAELEYL